MAPPLKRRGVTTKASVVTAKRPPSPTSSTAPSSRESSTGLEKAGRMTASISDWLARPPAPWAMVTVSSVSLGARRRQDSTRASTASRAS